MKTLTFLLVLVTLPVFGFGGCASGKKYSAVVEEIPPLAADSGRIYFYRDRSSFGAGVQTKIRLNDEVVGRSVAGGFFFVDRSAGDYEVLCATETKRKLSFTLEEGETRYVRTRVSFGAFIGPVKPLLEDEETAMKTLRKTKYIGSPLAEE